MNKYLCFLILFPLYSFAENKTDCKNAITTVDINICSKQEADVASSTLDEYLDKAKERYATEGNIITSLEKSQSAWLTYREAHCNAVYEQWSGGTIRGLMFNSCMLRLTKLRTHEIWLDYLTYIDSTEPLLAEPIL